MKGFDPGDMMESEGREERGVTTKKENPSAWRKQDPRRICSKSCQELTPSPQKNRIEERERERESTRAGRQEHHEPDRTPSVFCS